MRASVAVLLLAVSLAGCATLSAVESVE